MANGNPTPREEFFNEDVLAQFPELAAALGESAGELFPVDGLSEAEQAELANLTNRVQRLSPIAAPQAQASNAIPGNPFSINTAPVFNALQQGLTNVINAVRQKRLLGDPERAAELEAEGEALETRGQETTGGIGDIRDARKLISKGRALKEEGRRKRGVTTRLAELQGKQQTAEAAKSAQVELLKEIFPDAAGKLVQLEKELTVGEQKQKDILQRMEKKLGADLELVSARGREELDQLDKELDNTLAKMAFESELESEEAGREITSGDINNFRQIASEMTGVIDSDIAKKRVDLNAAEARAQSERMSEEQRQTARERALNLRSDIQALERQKKDILNNVFQRAAQQLNITPDEARNLFVPGGTPEGEDTTGSGGGGGIDYESLKSGN